MMNIPIILPTKTFGAILALGVACVAQAQTQPTVYHITENNESLTTDIPGATITVTPSILNQEQWTVTLGGGYTFSQGLVNPQYQIGEPESPSGAYVNLFADLPSWYAGTPNPPPYSSSIGYWISDTPNPSEYVYPSPDPVTAQGLLVGPTGQTYGVILADNESGNTVPEGGTTAALLATSMLALFCAARRFPVGAS